MKDGTRKVFVAVIRAMQAAEEIGGVPSLFVPEPREYVLLMRAIADEASARARRAEKAERAHV